MDVTDSIDDRRPSGWDNGYQAVRVTQQADGTLGEQTQTLRAHIMATWTGARQITCGQKELSDNRVSCFSKTRFS
jgi:hypothetical protein